MASVGDISSGVSGTSIFSTKSTTASKGKTGGDDLGKDDFLKLMLAQLQHQDPLKPMDDQAFIAQTAQFNALDEMTKLNKTLSTLLGAQQLAEASGMIGKTVSATDADGKAISGVVTAASVESGVAMVHIGKTKIELEKVTAVASEDADLPTADPASDGDTTTETASAREGVSTSSDSSPVTGWSRSESRTCTTPA
jgi:flagellar basal-body rod modification protein FlgD